MALTNDDRLFMTQLFDIKLEPIKQDVDKLKEDVNSLKEDVNLLKEDVNSLKEDVSSLKEDVSSLKEDVGSLKEEVGSLKYRMSSVEKDVSYLKFQNENEIIPRLQNIESCYISTYRRYVEKTEQIDEMKQDVDVLKTVVAEHSQILKNIS